MIVIKKLYVYHCYGGSHSSVVAASLHVGILQKSGYSGQFIQSLPYFDTQKATDHGILQFIGTDEYENLVFSVGLETVSEPVISAIRGILAIFGQHYHQLYFINTLPAVNIWMKLGGVCSRALGLKQIGLPLVTYGVIQALGDLQQLVSEVKEGKI